MIEYALKSPIENNEGEKVKVLKLPEPTIKQYTKLGRPFIISGEGAKFDSDILFKYISALSGITATALYNEKTGLKLSDLVNLENELMGFFGDSQET